MAMIRCPKCGEKYSDTYRECPFCEEEEALLDGEEIRRSPRRAAHSRQFNLITPTLIVLILLMAGLLIYLLYGDKLAEKFGGEKAPETPVEDVTPGTMPEEPDVQEPDDPSGIMPEEPDTPPQDEPEQPAEQEPSDYETAAKLPNGLSLSTTDFTLKSLGESHTIRVSGGSSTYQWMSQDDGIASVDQNGKVVAVSNGTVNVLVTDGSKKAVCIVRVNAAGGTTTTTPAAPAESGALKAGPAVVVNGGNGVRVRSGPGTNYEILASVSNGADIQIVESAGDGWYKITFSGAGGKITTGYMKGDFLKNN